MAIKRIIYCGELERTPDAPDHKGIRQGLEWLKQDGTIEDWKIVDPILNNRNQIIRLCNEFNPDLVIHGNTDSLTNDTISHIQGVNVFFMGDCRIDGYPFKEWSENAKGLQHIFISNRDQINEWHTAFGCPVSFWPHGCYVPDSLEYDKNFAYDVVFIGSFHDHGPLQRRSEFIREIQSKLTCKLTIINGDSVEGRNQVWRDMPKIYHSSKFVLDVSHFWHLEGYASGRYWYSAGLGGCSITKRFPGCEEFYGHRKHKMYFDTPEEAAHLVKDFWNEKFIREAMKHRAYVRNKKNFNYKVRFTEMINILNEGGLVS